MTVIYLVKTWDPGRRRSIAQSNHSTGCASISLASFVVNYEIGHDGGSVLNWVYVE